MFDDFFVSLLCLVNLFVFMGAALLFGWTRRSVTQMRSRLTTVETQLAHLYKAGSPVGQADEAAVSLTATAAAPRVEVPVAEMRVPAPTTNPTPPITVQDHWPEPEQLTPVQPAAGQSAGRWSQNPLLGWFVKVHLMVQAGVIVLFFGVGFLIKYAVDQGWFPLELRLLGAALLGVSLAAIGWRVRRQQRAYGLALIGGGIGIVYLTTFGAYFFYGLLPALLAFAIFVLLALAYALMAIWNDAPILALLALVGAFLAPWLTADGDGNHIVLFSYYAVVNAGVLAIAWYKAWPGLNLVSFLLSLLAGVAWAVTAYQPAYFASTELFLALFFGFYLTIAGWNALRTPQSTAAGKLTELDTGTVLLLFANGLASFVLQSALVADRGHWLAYSAFGFAAIYTLVGLFSHRRQAADLFTQVCFFFAGFFLLIGIPLRFDPQLTAAFWAVQGMGQLWIGARRQRTWPQVWGALVQLLAGGVFLIHWLEMPALALMPFMNHLYLSTLILALAAIMSATLVQRYRASARTKLAPLAYILLGLGFCWWYAGGIGQFSFYAARPDRLAILLLFFAISGILGELYGTFVRWHAPRVTLLTVLPAAALVALAMFGRQIHPFAAGWYVWPILLAVQLVHLWRGQPRQLTFYHAGTVWLTTFLLTWWTVEQVAKYDLTVGWLGIALLSVPTVVLLLCGVLAAWLPWPIAGNHRAYVVYVAAPVALFLLIAALWVNQTNPGDSAPVPFVPFLNPLDLLLGTVIVILWQWSRCLLAMLSTTQGRSVDQISQWGVWLVSLWVFNLALARGLHHLSGVPFTFSALYDSALVQMTYALVWSLLAFAFMYIAHHRHWRHVWSIGATLLGITIIKLFLVDLAHTGSLARIVSFIGVGLLTITIAYFWPAPPRDRQPLPTTSVV